MVQSSSPIILLEELISNNNGAMFANAINNAYEKVDEMCVSLFDIQNKSRLQEEFRVRAINYAVEATLIRAIEKGHLKEFKYKEELNKKKNCNHLKLTHEKAIITISQVETPTAFPRYADFRTEHRYNAQGILFEDMIPVSDSIPYVLITHGYKSETPKFIKIGIPEPLPVEKWAAQIHLPITAINSILPSEDVPDAIILELKENIQKYMDNE